MASRRLDEERLNQDISPQVEKVEQVPQDGKGSQDAQVPPQGDPKPNVEGRIEVPEMSNREIREALIAIGQAVTMQANLNIMPRVVESTITSRLRDFMRMNTLIFLGSKVNQDPYLDGVYKFLSSMVVTSKEKAEFASNQLRDISQICYTQQKDNGLEGSDPIEW